MTLTHHLKKHFKHNSFRSNQESSIGSAINGHDVLVVEPTGGGKSLCYQLPAMILPGTTLVISPLISLMKNQVDALVKIGIPAAYINSTCSPMEKRAIYRKLARADIKLL